MGRQVRDALRRRAWGLLRLLPWGGGACRGARGDEAVLWGGLGHGEVAMCSQPSGAVDPAPPLQLGRILPGAFYKLILGEEEVHFILHAI